MILFLYEATKLNMSGVGQLLLYLKELYWEILQFLSEIQLEKQLQPNTVSR